MCSVASILGNSARLLDVMLCLYAACCGVVMRMQMRRHRQLRWSLEKGVSGAITTLYVQQKLLPGYKLLFRR
jgi:hypothetical protein